MSFDNAVHLRQAKPRATFALGGKEWFEDPRLQFGRYARSTVLDFDNHVPVSATSAQPDAAALGQDVDGVEDQVGQCLAHGMCPAFDHDTSVDLDVQLNVRRIHLR